MFTGIVEELGSVVSLEHQRDAIRLTIEGPLVTGDARLGDSISVNGCCLTVAEREGSRFTADVMHQTLELTSLGDLRAGSRVNLERAVTPTTRLGGHLVQGHVDATGHVLRRTPGEHWEVVEVSLPAHLERYLVPQGSITVDGVSLTVAELEGGCLTADVMLQTLELTSLGDLRAGSRVNLERAVTPTTRLGGHLVQGHVDGTGHVLRRTPGEHWEVVEVSLPAHLERYLVPQGSITVDGVSLTVAEVREASFTVSLIPETLVRTVLGDRAVGETVNLEVDVIAKYVEKMVTR